MWKGEDLSMDKTKKQEKNEKTLTKKMKSSQEERCTHKHKEA